MSRGYFTQELCALDFGHALIADDDVGGTLCKHPARFGERRCRAHVVFIAEHLLKEVQTYCFVINVKNSSFQLHTFGGREAARILQPATAHIPGASYFRTVQTKTHS